MPTQSPLHFAETPGELLDVAEHAIPPTDWPPPGTHIVHRPTVDPGEIADRGATLFYAVADSGELPTEGFWWTTLGNLLLDDAIDEDLWGPILLAVYVESVPTWAGPFTAIPIYYRGGQGAEMRWIRTTYRGVLGGGVEQFQFKIDLGNPGADPDPDEAACLALAEQLAGLFVDSANALLSYVSTEVRFDEVGVVKMTATSGTDAQGEGGDMEQSFPTQWFSWPTISRPFGQSSGNALPYEVACCVTLHTDHRGPSGRGRFYLPPLSVSAMSAGGLFGVGPRDNCLAGTVQFLDLIVDNTPYVPVVVSPRRIILNEIVSVDVGRVPDSQRRRRRSQDEARAETLLGA